MPLTNFLDLPPYSRCMLKLTDRIEQLEESATIAMSQRSRDLRAKGIDIINLSLGEPDFNTPDFIKAAAKKAIDDNITHYPPVPGFPEVRKAIADKLKRDNGIDYAPEQIVISTGAKQSIINAVLCLVNPGDEVILPTPFWVSYKEMVRFAEGEAVEVPTTIEEDFKLSPAKLEAAITDKTRMIIFSSPSNPTGSAYSEAELRALAAIIEKFPDVLVICDEIYEHIRFIGKHFSMAAIPEIHDRVITINGVSKAFAMTGWRIGYLAASKEIAAACTKMQGQFTSAASGISQKAAQAAFEADPSEIKFMVDAFEKRRQLMIDGLRKIEGVECNEPEGAFYLFPRIINFFGKSTGSVSIQSSEDLCMYLLEEGHVATVPGSAFGLEGYIRLSYAASEQELLSALERIQSALEKLS